MPRFTLLAHSAENEDTYYLASRLKNIFCRLGWQHDVLAPSSSDILWNVLERICSQFCFHVDVLINFFLERKCYEEGSCLREAEAEKRKVESAKPCILWLCIEQSGSS